MPLRYDEDDDHHHQFGVMDTNPLNVSGSTTSGGSHSSFSDEQQEEGRITFHHDENDPLRPQDDESFNSEEFQAQEKEAITKEIRSRRKKMYALVGVGILVLLAIIVIPVTIAKSNSNKNKSTDNQKDEIIEIPTDDKEVQADSNRTSDVVADGSGGVAATTNNASDTTTTTTTTTQEEGTDGAPAEGGNPFFQEGEDQQAAGGANQETGNSGPIVVELMDIPEVKPSSLSGYSTDILTPYSDQAALEQDVTLAAQDMVDAILRQNLQMIADFAAMTTPSSTIGGGMRMRRKLETTTTSSTSSSSSRKNGDRETDVREGDTVQEDGTFVYAAYGDTLVVWNRFTGTMITSEQLPPPSTEASNTNGGYGPWIHSLHLTNQHLFVFAGGYSTYDHSYGAKPPVTRGDNSSKLFVYNRLSSVNDEELVLVATQSLNGQHLRTRYLEETGTFHIITGLDINADGYFGNPLTFLNFYPEGYGINATDYYERATKLANEQLIPDFVQGLTKELMENNQGQLPTTMKVNNWQLPGEQQGRKLSQQALQVYEIGKYGHDEGIRAYVQILTLKPDELSTDTFESDSLPFKSSVVMGPSSDIAFHAAGDNIVLAVDKFTWDTETGMTDEQLFLIQLKVNGNDGGSTSFVATTSLQGRLGMPFAQGYPMDIQDDDLRIATTFQSYFPLDKVYGLCGHVPNNMGTSFFGAMPPDKCRTDESWIQCHDLVMEGCTNVTKTSCPYTYECIEEGDGDSSTENHVVVLGLSGGETMPEKGRVKFGNDHDFIQALSFGKDFSYALTSRHGIDGPFYVLNLQQGQEPSVAYALAPSQIQGGLPATYLQPINEAGTLLVGIGQNSTGSLMFEVETGLTVSVIDVSDPNAPVVLASQMLKREESFSAPASSAEFDARSVQYTDDGHLIIPLTMFPDYNTVPTFNEEVGDFNDPSSEANMQGPTMFEGFTVLDLSNVAKNGIKEILRLNHVSSRSGQCDIMCMDTNFIPNHRAFWYKDENSLMTMFDHKVFSINMATYAENWELNVTSSEAADSNCCF